MQARKTNIKSITNIHRIKQQGIKFGANTTSKITILRIQLELVDTIKITIKKKGNMKINQHETDQYGKIKTIYREKMIERTE